LIFILIVAVAAGIGFLLLGKSRVADNLREPRENVESLIQADPTGHGEDAGLSQTEIIGEARETIEAAIRSEKVVAPESPSVEGPSEEGSPGTADERSKKAETQEVPAVSENPGTRVAVAQAGETVSEIIFREFGSFDVRILPIVQRLNPEIEDLDRIIDVGQRLRLPLDFNAALERSIENE
jgi:hypothetical protein